MGIAFAMRIDLGFNHCAGSRACIRRQEGQNETYGE